MPACSVHGLTHECTEVGCALPFEIALHGGGAPGAYEFAIQADAQSTTCTVTVPFTCDQPLRCMPEAPSFYLEMSGCTLPPNQQAITGIGFFDVAPDNIAVTVRRDGAPVAQASYAPVYELSRPNGPECEPVCRTAAGVELDL